MTTNRTGSVNCTCLACGTKFKESPSRVLLGCGKYCTEKCRREFWGYRRAVEVLLPCTIKEMQSKSAAVMDSIRKIVHRSLASGEWHASHLVKNERHHGRGVATYEIVFAMGPSKDLNLPRNIRGALTYLTKQLVIKAMPATQRELIKKTGLAQGTISRMVRNLHEQKKCHISGWKPTKRGDRMARYKGGPGEDVPNTFEPLTSAETSARYRIRLIRNGRIDEYRARGAANSRASKMRRAGDPFINALFGKPAERLKAA